ncbi:MAG TPA: NFACT family protein [Dongiaceae bacterium]|nr:NFACT family protein [Dongiaceae bacterium]
MNSLTLRGVLAEIAALTGQRLERVVPLDPRSLRLDFGSKSLVVSGHPRHGTLFVTVPDDAAGAPTFPFAELVKTHLEGSRLAGAVQAGLDRVTALHFEARDRLGDISHRHLIAELTGPRADLVLVEGVDPWTGRIRGHLRTETRTRYALPVSPKIDASVADDADLAATLARSIETHGPGPQALVQAWQGVSPAIAREILERTARPDHPLDVVAAWRDLLLATRPRSAHPTLITRPDGTSDVESFVPWHSSEERASFPSLSAALAENYRRFRDESGRRSAPWRALLSAIDRTERALAAVDREKVETGTSAEWRRLGEAILAHAHAMPRGLSEAEIPDPAAEGRLLVRLNPRLSATENADLFFKKARKAARRDPALQTRRRDIEAQRKGLETLRVELEQSEPDEAWLRRAEALGVRLPREVSPAATSKEPADRLPSALRPRRYDLGNGWEAMVGKSNRGNDVLTFELARPGDVWMHAHQSAGSHLVLRHDEKGKEPPRSVLVSAACIAAYYSKARGSSKVPVLVSHKRFVRKPRKAPIGMVTVSKYETLLVAPHCPEENGR